MSGKREPPHRPARAPAHACTAACACPACGGRTWYSGEYSGLHACASAGCGWIGRLLLAG